MWKDFCPKGGAVCLFVLRVSICHHPELKNIPWRTKKYQGFISVHISYTNGQKTRQNHPKILEIFNESSTPKSLVFCFFEQSSFGNELLPTTFCP